LTVLIVKVSTIRAPHDRHPLGKMRRNTKRKMNKLRLALEMGKEKTSICSRHWERKDFNLLSTLGKKRLQSALDIGKEKTAICPRHWDFK